MSCFLLQLVERRCSHTQLLWASSFFLLTWVLQQKSECLVSICTVVKELPPSQPLDCVLVKTDPLSCVITTPKTQMRLFFFSRMFLLLYNVAACFTPAPLCHSTCWNVIRRSHWKTTALPSGSRRSWLPPLHSGVVSSLWCARVCVGVCVRAHLGSGSSYQQGPAGMLAAGEGVVFVTNASHSRPSRKEA